MAKHRWKGAAKRNAYAFVLSPTVGWVRIFRRGDDVQLVLP